MSLGQPCRRCGADLRTKQVNNILANYCDYCGSQPFAVNVKTGEGVTVDRNGVPHEPSLKRPARITSQVGAV